MGDIGGEPSGVVACDCTLEGVCEFVGPVPSEANAFAALLRQVSRVGNSGLDHAHSSYEAIV